MALTKVINDLADLNQSGTTNALKGCAGTTAEQPASSSSIEYLIVGGGGMAMGDGSGGGGAGGLLTGSTTVYHGTPTVITVGEGAPAKSTGYACCGPYSGNGSDSGFNGIRALGGGSAAWRFAASGSWAYYTQSNGGGSGAGGGQSQGGAGSDSSLPGDGTSGQGLGGGASASGASNVYATGGGGGAGTTVDNTDGTGETGTSGQSGNGGSGRDMQSFISNNNANLSQIGEVSGSNVWFAGGGGGGGNAAVTCGVGYSTLPGTGGLGGGGTGSNTNGGNGENGQTNTGGGGGGGAACGAGYGGAGGSGVAILKYNNTIVTGYTLNSEDTYTVNWPTDKFGVAYWPLNLDVKDVGGYYDGTATDITYVTGKFNQAASFNGSSSVIKATQPSHPENFTISAWVKTTVSGSWNVIVGMGGVYGVAANGLSMWISGSTNSLHASWGNGTNEDYWSTSPTTLINTGAWFHVAITVNNIASPTVKGYINGVLEGSGSTGSDPITYKPNEFSIGAREHDGGTVDYYWNGEIEQVRFYGSELSLTDVQDIYNNSKPGSLPPLSSTAPTIDSLSFPSGATAVALYEFQGNGDSTDSASNNQTTVGTITYNNGKWGEAASGFSGSNYFATSGLVGTLLGTTAAKSFTISAWIKTPTNGSNEQAITGNTAGSSNSGASLYIRTDGKLTFLVSAGGSNGGNGAAGGPYAYTEQVVADNTWHHIAVTYSSDGTTAPSTTAGLLGLFVDGINVTSSATFLQSGSPWTNGTANPWTSYTDNYFRTGRWDSGTNHLDGEIDQLRIYQSVLTDTQIYNLWQKETNIQTHFTSGSTDTLVFKEGSGEITFKNDSPPGAEVGMLRYNNTLGQMEHFNSGGWKDFTNCTTSMCNYPITARCLYTFNGNYDDLCGNTTPDLIQNVYFTPGKFDKLGWNVLGLSSYLGYSKIGWSSGLIADYNATDFSISLWLKLNAYGGASALQYPYIWSGWSNAYWSLHMANTSAANTISFGSWSSADGSQEVHSGVVALDTWYHIVCTRSTTTGIQLWLNNVLISTLGTVYNGGAASVYDMMGGYGDTGYTRQGLDGTISQFRLFEAVLTPTQISQLYNEASCPNN